MRSAILMTATRYLLPLMLLFSLFVLLRGHNDPGGGFVGGLVAGAAFSLYTIAYGMEDAQRALNVQPIRLIAIGLLLALTSGLLGLALGRPLMTGLWQKTFHVPVVGELGSPFLFDVGVYLVVMGITLKIVFSLAEE